jgi:hypothetical protein
VCTVEKNITKLHIANLERSIKSLQTEKDILNGNLDRYKKLAIENTDVTPASPQVSLPFNMEKEFSQDSYNSEISRLNSKIAAVIKFLKKMFNFSLYYLGHI